MRMRRSLCSTDIFERYRRDHSQRERRLVVFFRPEVDICTADAGGQYPTEVTRDPARDEALMRNSLDWYDRTRSAHESLRDELLKEVPTYLRASGLKHFRVESRVKGRSSYEAKLRKNPVRQVEDVVGLRILVFFRSDIPWAQQVMWNMLVLDEGSYVDKGDLLSDAGFGYRSIQFVGRTKIGGFGVDQHPIWDAISNSGTKVEVQIRTMLEHAWAEVDHGIRYKATERATGEIDRQFALTAALLEQADSNLDDVREKLHLGLSNSSDVAFSNDLVGWDAERFVQSDRESLALDKTIAAALDLDETYVMKSTREVAAAAHLAEWTRYAEMKAGIRDHHKLGRRLAIACANIHGSLILADYNHNQEPAHTFKGVGLYWTALAVALGVNELDPFSDHPHISIPDGRLMEFKAVARHLIDHPDESALAVRGRYFQQAAPPGTTERRLFSEVRL